MKQRTSFVNRCIALALALMLLVSQANLGILQHARAAENDASTATAQKNNLSTTQVSKDTNLFAVIAENYGTEKVAAILNSGAVKGNEAISYTVPSEAELAELVKLEDYTLTAQSVASGYADLSWVPYSYVVDGGAEQLFNGKNEVVIDGMFTKVDVNYRLTLTNHSAAAVQGVLDLAAELAAEAETQKSLMDTLASYKNDAANLNLMVLRAVLGVIDYYIDTYGEKVVGEMKATINEIINNGFNTDEKLELGLIIDAYINGGLTYYYQNSAYVKEVINFMSEHLSAMLNEEEGHKNLLVDLLTAMNFSQYIDKLDGLKEKIADIDAQLSATNAAIDTTDVGKLANLVAALTMEGETAATAAGSPYVKLAPVTRNSDLYATVNVEVVAGGKSHNASVTIAKGQALTQAQVDALKAEINEFVNGTIDTTFYTNTFNNGAELDALVGVALTKSATYTYTWTAIEFEVEIEGNEEDEQIVTVEDLNITLPAHPNAANGMSYIYVIGDKVIEVTDTPVVFTFEAAELQTLFVGGTLSVVRAEKNVYVENLREMVANVNEYMGFEALTLIGVEGFEDVYTGIEANIVAADVMDLMLALIMKSGYSYIGLNNQDLVYANDKNELEMSLQTLVNAICLDEDFDNDMLIALGENGNGKLLKANMDLGKTSGIQFDDLQLTINLTSVPQKLVDYANYVKLASKYITFKGDNGAMAFEVNLPDQAYAAYAAALVATGNVAKNDVNGMTQKVPAQFLYDYLTAITGSEMDLVTYSNTLEMLGINKDLADYNKYYEIGMNAYNEYVEVDINDDKTAVTVNTPVKTVVDILMNLLGIENETLNLLLPLLAEYKHETEVALNATGKLKNVDKTYYALILDAQAEGLRNKVEAPTSYNAIAAETKSLAGYSAIILTADVPGDLTISGTTVLDLNGFNVEGTINATGKLFIIDSSMSTYAAGTVENVTGNAVILAGNYNSDISALLKDGYYMEGTTVRNALYTMSEENGNLTFTLDYESAQMEGYLPDVKALAVDIASDLLLNYFMTAKLSVEGIELVAIDVDDLVGLYAGDNRIATLAKTLFGCVTIGEEGYENNVGFEALVNLILEDLLDFDAITEALNNNTALFSYDMTTAPWLIEVDHNTEADYATLDVRYNDALAKTTNISLVVKSSYNDNVAAMTEVLAEIVVKDETYVEVDIPTPTYSDKTLTISGAGKASLVMDMSGSNTYANVLGVILAYGNPDKAEAVAAALNNNDMDALKVVVDNTSVKELFTALKKLNRGTSFTAMAAQVGVTVDTTDAAELEAKFHLVFCAAGKVLEELEITGMDSKLGALYNDETGYYELTKENIFRDKEFNIRSYSALVELEATELTLKVKLFADCMWGDANHDNVVDSFDASLVEQYAVGTAPESFCTIRTDVNGDGSIDSFDAALIRMYTVGSITVFPAENK